MFVSLDIAASTLCQRSHPHKPAALLLLHPEPDLDERHVTYLEADVLAAKADLELLTTVLVLLGPLAVVFLHDLRRADDALDLVDDEA